MAKTREATPAEQKQQLIDGAIEFIDTLGYDKNKTDNLKQQFNDINLSDYTLPQLINLLKLEYKKHESTVHEREINNATNQNTLKQYEIQDNWLDDANIDCLIINRIKDQCNLYDAAGKAMSENVVENMLRYTYHGAVSLSKSYDQSGEECQTAIVKNVFNKIFNNNAAAGKHIIPINTSGNHWIGCGVEIKINEKTNKRTYTVAVFDSRQNAKTSSKGKLDTQMTVHCKAMLRYF